MIINLAFFIVIAVSVIRTVAYGIYALKNESRCAGISVFILALGSFSTALVILFTEVLQR